VSLTLGINNQIEKIIPERLKEARIARGYSMAELAKIIEVTPQTISQYESGKITPSWDVLRKIINVLDFPLSYFTKRYDDDSAEEDTIFFRSLRSTSKKSRSMSEKKIKWSVRFYNFLDKFVSFPSLDIPNWNEILKNDLSDETLEYLATELRKYWGLGLGPISNLTLLLEKKGFLINRLKLNQDKIDAFSTWMSGRPFIFLCSDKNSSVRSRFDLAHELTHMIIHKNVKKNDLQNASKLREIERQANYFAGAFLLPRESFGAEVMSSSLDHFITLKKRWKVSIAAMITRCEQLKILSDNQIIYLNKQLSLRGMRKREPLDDEIRPETPEVFKQAVNLIIENSICSPARIVDALALNPIEIEEQFNLDTGILRTEGKVIPLKLKKE